MSQFTIIVPIFQTPGILQLFLDSLVQTLEADTDLIFINDGSGTSVQNILEHFRERHAQTLVVQNHLSQGAARAINLGLQRVNPSCEYVVFLDSDTILQEGWQSRLRMCFSTPEIGAVGGMLLYPQSGGVQCCGITYSGSVGKHVYLNANPEHFPLQHPFEVQASVFAFCCIRHNVVEKLGLLDEEFYNGYEDLDYQFRMRKLGYHIFTDPAIRLYHWEKSNGSHRSYNRKSNLGRFWQKHGEFVQSDLTQFLQLCLDGQLHSAGPYNAIDFCEGRSDAVRVRDWIDTTSGMSIDSWKNESFSCRAQDSIWLPEVLGSGSVQNRNPFLFLCDQMIQLLDNRYWWTLREKCRTDDLIIDLYGNVVPLAQLQHSFWPGRKIR